VLLGGVAGLYGLMLRVHSGRDILEGRQALASISVLAYRVSIGRYHRLVVVLVPEGHDSLGRSQTTLVQSAAYLRQRNAVMANAYLLR
jgi:hypothetical protein